MRRAIPAAKGTSCPTIPSPFPALRRRQTSTTTRSWPREKSTFPSAGTYTFDGNTDDGFSMTITGASFISGTNDTSAGGNTFEYDGTRGAADTLGVANFSSAGYYPISLTFFQGGGPSGVEISAAQGAQTAFSSSLFHLIGDTADGGLAMGGTYAPPPSRSRSIRLRPTKAAPVCRARSAVRRPI